MSEVVRAATKQSRRAFLRLGVGGLGLIGLAAACAPAPAPAPPKATEAPKAAEAAKPTAAAAKPAEAAKPTAAAAAPAAAPKQAAPAASTGATGKAVLVLGHEPPTLDTLIDSSNTVRIHAFDNIHEGLVMHDPEMKMIPGLAKSWERIDPTRMRFKLEQGVKFTDGEAFNADSVVASIKRLNDAKSSLLSFIDTLDRAEKVDDYTVDVVTRGPDPILARRLTFLPIYGAKFIETKADSAADKPIGTGPYKLKEWIKGQHLVLEANPDYWGPLKPTIKEIEFIPRKEPSVRLTALKAGEAHLIDNINPEDAATLPKEQVLSKFATECMILRPNSLKGVTADKRVRLAMSHALDRKAIAKDIMGGFANEPNGQLYIPSTFGYDTTMKDHEYDPDKARALVKEAGATGKELSIVGISVNRWLKDREVQEIFTEQINQTGLKVNLKLMEQAEWLKAGRNVTEPPMDVWFTSAGNDLVDPDRIIYAYGKTGGRLSLYSNPELDKLIDAERAELDEKKREEILKQIGRHIHENAAIIPIAQQHWIYGISPKLTYPPYPNGQIPGNRLTLKS